MADGGNRLTNDNMYLSIVSRYDCFRPGAGIRKHRRNDSFRLAGDVRLSKLPAPDRSFRHTLEGRQCGASSRTRSPAPGAERSAPDDYSTSAIPMHGAIANGTCGRLLADAERPGLAQFSTKAGHFRSHAGSDPSSRRGVRRCAAAVRPQTRWGPGHPDRPSSRYGRRQGAGSRPRCPAA